jgi:hypothetical protein
LEESAKVIQLIEPFNVASSNSHFCLIFGVAHNMRGLNNNDNDGDSVRQASTVQVKEEKRKKKGGRGVQERSNPAPE